VGADRPSPTYDQQLALDAYGQGIGGLTFLPGMLTFLPVVVK
jgi:hypothetical protein